ncbi:MAG: hypothetical protein EA360_01060 [Balneolaceae bacterium]|nr:MAG: hypothetical protein EA360_01060 [Balneolaceae bacterium]
MMKHFSGDCVSSPERIRPATNYSMTVLCFLLLILPLPGHGSNLNNNEAVSYEEKLDEAIRLYYNTDWVGSSEIFEWMKQEHPDDPRPYFFESMKPFMEYFFIEASSENADRFLESSEIAVQLSQQALRASPNDTTMVLMLSGLHGYRGLVAAGENRHRIALSSGLTGFNYTRKLLSMDSARPDARIGRGMFYYMVGSIPSGMRWASNMVGLRADIEDGFEELKKAAETDSYLRNDAWMMLMYLYGKEERYEEALFFADKLTQALPENVIFLYRKAEIHEKLGNVEQAIATYRAISELNNRSIPRVAEKSLEKIENLKQLTSI